MSDILILTHAEFCPPGHLGAVLAARGLDFRVIRATCRRAPSACCPARGARTRGFPGAITYSACKAIRK